MLKTSENPPLLYPEGVELDDLPGQWWVARTKSRNEKALAWDLLRYEIGYFLPLVEKVSRRGGRVLRSQVPLFGGYLFFCGDEDGRYRALRTNRIAQVLEVTDQAGLKSQLKQIHQALSSGLSVDAHPGLKVGKRCRVRSGSLMGSEGKVLRRNKITRILLEVEMLGQSAAVEIDADLLEEI